MPKTSRPSLDARAKEVLRLARLESKLSARYRKSLSVSEGLHQELRSARKLLRELMADVETFGPDGRNEGELPGDRGADSFITGERVPVVVPLGGQARLQP
jgi:hypothetical protein